MQGTACATEEPIYFPVAEPEDSARPRNSPAAHINSEPFDFLIQGGKRNLKIFRRFGLIPFRAFEHVADHAPLNFIHDLKQGSFRAVGAGARTVFARQRRHEF